ncbi:helix-turn-helix transcriptional regulator [Fulvivirga sp. 29W222]|uniref:Helix-turn-helix transcriptional regulator n=1 Tax=Fulvivirga marina TaxID=2494733 RepID=A0A937FYN4_9BACT|nr:helix-turn-helix transcriptional regulator [Fulvivirga marina]MBL6445346.1 helix-turn-helix transcriptional regulator [Fulvivirga marina]
MNFNTIYATIAAKISYFRAQKKISQEELAQKIQELTGETCGKHAISRFENSRRKLPINYVPALAQIFDITTDELFFSANELKRTDKDQIGTRVADYRELATTNPKEAASKALEALLNAKKEVQALKEQLRKYEEELEKKSTKMKKYKEIAKSLSELSED